MVRLFVLFLLTCSPSPCVVVTWVASTTPSVTYNMWESAVKGGPYTKMNAHPITSTNWTNWLAKHQQNRCYVVTSVDSTGAESIHSNESCVFVP